MKRLPFPALMHNAPSCPVCYATVSFNGDGWECKTCHVTWSSDAYDYDGYPFEWREGEYPQWQPEPAEVTS
jgi:tRNA(Ile2) C34 agmatinyltransferase TiaS